MSEELYEQLGIAKHCHLKVKKGRLRITCNRDADLEALFDRQGELAKQGLEIGLTEIEFVRVQVKVILPLDSLVNARPVFYLDNGNQAAADKADLN